MAAPQHSPKLTVAESLQQNGVDLSAVFVGRRTACVGCYLAGFCTLEDVANTYGFSLDGFLGELDRAADTDNPAFSGAQNA
jgi:hypothetical protein